MTDYARQAQLVQDGELRGRVTACAAGLGIENPLAWAYEHAWQLAVRPGWSEAAVDGSAGITDAMILAAVEDLYLAEPAESNDDLNP